MSVKYDGMGEKALCELLKSLLSDSAEEESQSVKKPTTQKKDIYSYLAVSSSLCLVCGWRVGRCLRAGS